MGSEMCIRDSIVNSFKLQKNSNEPRNIADNHVYLVQVASHEKAQSGIVSDAAISIVENASTSTRHSATCATNLSHRALTRRELQATRGLSWVIRLRRCKWELAREASAVTTVLEPIAETENESE